VPLDRPRDRNSSEFSKIRKEIYDEFFTQPFNEEEKA